MNLTNRLLKSLAAALIACACGAAWAIPKAAEDASAAVVIGPDAAKPRVSAKAAKAPAARKLKASRAAHNAHAHAKAKSTSAIGKSTPRKSLKGKQAGKARHAHRTPHAHVAKHKMSARQAHRAH